VKNLFLRKYFLLILSFILILFLSNSWVGSKEDSLNIYVPQKNKRDIRIMFYNAENLFDTYDDINKRDEEFLPGGEKHWTNYRYKQKLNNIYKVITAVGEWDPPEIVGLCEIENRNVLEDLVTKTPLSKFKYKIVHRESPDERGIDVALLYIEDRFRVLRSDFIQVVFPFDKSLKTREILYVKGIFYTDTLHLFVNHWPSRSGGQYESERKRLTAAALLNQKIDSVFSVDPLAYIIVMGDFNDEPEDKSLISLAELTYKQENVFDKKLYNLCYYLKQEQKTASYKYRGTWEMFDQFIVSGSLLNKQSSIYTTENDVYVFMQDFLLEKDEGNFGFKPFRTYSGYRYINGYSDHLPVYLDLRRN